MDHILRMFIFGVCVAVLSSCSVSFNFTGGGTVDPRLKTLSIDNFLNEAPVVVPFLSQELNQQMQDRFLSQSNLTLTSGSADIRISGIIRRYDLRPVAVTGNETASQNRLTIGVMIKYDNVVEPNESWEKDFSRFVDFDASEDFTSVEPDLIEEIVEQITQDVFTESVGNW
ncbi:MAG: LptE family protein [Bacteroidota bacterium]